MLETVPLQQVVKRTSFIGYLLGNFICKISPFQCKRYSLKFERSLVPERASYLQNELCNIPKTWDGLHSNTVDCFLTISSFSVMLLPPLQLLITFLDLF